MKKKANKGYSKAAIIEAVGDGTYTTRNPQLEKQVLKALFNRPEKIGIVSAVLRPEHFADVRYSDIYAKTIELYNSGRMRRADTGVVLAECLRRPVEDLEIEDYQDAVSDISREVIEVDLDQAIVILNNLMLARHLQAFSCEVSSRASAGDDIESLISDATSRIRSISIDSRIEDTLESFDDIIARQPNGADSIIEPARNGIPTPFPALNDMTHGFMPTDVTVIGGRPGNGKTVLLMQSAYHSACLLNHTVVYSHEMTVEQFMTRMMCAYCDVMSTDVRMLELTPREKARCREWLYDNPARKFLKISESGGKTPAQVRADLIRYADKHGSIGLVCIDYMQQMRSGLNFYKRNEEVAEISKALKSIAKELKVPIVAISTMSREFSKRQGKDNRPILEDLGESGQIEFDASVVLFPHQPSKYSKSTNGPVEDDEFVVRKNRHGPTGIVKVKFNQPYSRFENLP